MRSCGTPPPAKVFQRTYSSPHTHTHTHTHTPGAGAAGGAGGAAGAAAHTGPDRAAPHARGYIIIIIIIIVITINNRVGQHCSGERSRFRTCSRSESLSESESLRPEQF